jgi:hypothetical protein
VHAYDMGTAGSHYDLSQTSIHLHGQTLAALDLDLVLHEYGHALHHAIGGLGSSGYPFDGAGTSGNGGMDEGWADYRGASFLNDPEFGEGSGIVFLGDWRTLENTWTVDLNWRNSRYKQGVIWGGAF